MISPDNKLKIKDITINSRVIASPMAGITDYIYRKIMREFSKETLIYSEMISSEALIQNRPHRVIITTPEDRPIAFQLSGHKPHIILESAKMILHLCDIVDVNMGCPIPKIVKNGDGSALMKTPELAADIVKTLAQNISKPVTVKFRLGWDSKSINCIDFAKLMEDSGAAMITVHARTRNQMYAGKAKWKYLAKVKAAVSIPVIANGDVDSPEAAVQCLNETGCDGVAVGRGLLGDPWLVSRIDQYLKTGELISPPTTTERLDMAIRHSKMLADSLGEEHGIKHSRKFFAWYIKFIPGAAHYRSILTRLDTFDEVKTIIDEIKSSLVEKSIP